MIACVLGANRRVTATRFGGGIRATYPQGTDIVSVVARTLAVADLQPGAMAGYVLDRSNRGRGPAVLADRTVLLLLAKDYNALAVLASPEMAERLRCEADRLRDEASRPCPVRHLRAVEPAARRLS